MEVKLKWEYFVLCLIFLLAIAIRLFYVYKIDVLNYDAYFSVRQIEHIISDGVPLYHDNLSYSGRDFFISPFYYYVIAFFRFFLSEKLAYLIIPNVIASALILVAYLISYHVTRNRLSAIFSSMLIALSPIYTSTTIISLSPVMIAIILFFLCLYFFMKYEENVNYMWLFLASFILLIFTHTIAYLLIFGLLLYLVLLKLENLKHAQEEIELVMFSFLTSIWVFVIVFKKPLLTYGPVVVWENLPKIFIEQFYAKFDILIAVYESGLIPFLLGLYVIFLYFFQRRKKSIYLLISIVIVIFLVTWLRYVQFEISLILLSILLTILSAQGFVVIVDYFKKTYFVKFLWIFILLLFIISIIFSSLSLNYFVKKALMESPNQEEISAIKWLTNSPENSIIAAPLNFGHLITSIAKRGNIMDSSFLLAPDVNQRYNDLTVLYDKYTSETEAVGILNKYGSTYIIYEASKPDYVNDANCFRLEYNESVQIFRLTCKVEEYG